MPKQREKMTEVHSCGSPPFSTCLGAVASFIISQGQKCHKKPFPLVYYQSHKEIVAGIVGIISVIVGVALKMNNNAIAIIGGADGPTSVFVAGKLNSVLVSILLIAIGVVMLIVAIIFYLKRKR